MSTPAFSDAPPLPYCVCGARHGWTNLSRTGGQQWVCADCERPSAMVYFQQASRNNPTLETHQMTTKTVDINALLSDLRDVIDAHLNGGKPAIETPAPSRAKVKPAKEVEPEEDEAAEDNDRRAELEAMTIAALRKLAIKMGYRKDDVDEAKKDEIIDTILEEEANAESEEEEEVEEDEAEEEEGELTREELEALGLVALKKIAKDEHGETTASLKGLDKDSIIDIILGETEEEEEDEDEEEDEEEEEEADDDGEEEVTEDYLNGLSLNELRAKAKEWGYTVRPGMKRDQITDLFFGG